MPELLDFWINQINLGAMNDGPYTVRLLFLDVENLGLFASTGVALAECLKDWLYCLSSSKLGIGKEQPGNSSGKRNSLEIIWRKGSYLWGRVN